MGRKIYQGLIVTSYTRPLNKKSQEEKKKEGMENFTQGTRTISSLKMEKPYTLSCCTDIGLCPCDWHLLHKFYFLYHFSILLDIVLVYISTQQQQYTAVCFLKSNALASTE